MKNYKNWGLVAASVLLATMAAWVAHVYLANRETEIKQQLAGAAEKVDVVVPTADLQAGQMLRGDMVARRPMPKDLVPTGAITPEEFQAFDGLTLKQPVAKGTPLLRHLLIGASADDKFSGLLKSGQRALTFSVDDKQSTSHLLRPGDFVDVVLSPKPQDSNKSDNGSDASPPVFGLIKERVLVLATGAKSVADERVGGASPGEAAPVVSTDFQTITLAVETKEIPLFLTALQVIEADKAQLLFLLRNPTDEGHGHFGSSNTAVSHAIEVYGGSHTSGGELQVGLTRPIGVNTKVATFGNNGEARLYQRYGSADASDVIKKSESNGNQK